MPKRTVYKYKVEHSLTTITLPKGAQFLHFGPQQDGLYVWFEVDTSAEPILRAFDVIGTGMDLAPTTTWLATAQTGPLVWHLYEHTA